MVRIIVITLLSFPAFLFAQEGGSVQEPSLAELARKEREKRQEATTPARVITNEDLGTMRGGRVVTTRSSTSSRVRRQAAKESTEEAEEKAPEVDEPDPSSVEYWEPIFKEAVDNLKYVANASLVLELRINNMRNGYFREQDGVRREAIYAEIAKTAEELGKSREEENEARDAVLKLQRDAQKAGLTPGEVRELTGKLPERKSFIELPELRDPDLEG